VYHALPFAHDVCLSYAKEEPEPATKKVSKKKAAKKAKAAALKAAAAAPAAAAKQKSKKAANGSTPGGVGSQQNGGGDTEVSDPWGAQHAGGEWQTGPIGTQEGEWETVSHKRSRPRKERAAVANEANVIPGGLGL